MLQPKQHMRQYLLHGRTNLLTVRQQRCLLQHWADCVLWAVLYWAVHWWRLLQRSFIGMCQHLLPGWFAVLTRQMLSQHAGLQPTVLPGRQRLYQQSVRASWEHGLWLVFLPVR